MRGWFLYFLLRAMQQRWIYRERLKASKGRIRLTIEGAGLPLILVVKMATKIYRTKWNDHESLFRAHSVSEAREQAQLLYGRDALSRRACQVALVSDEDLVRLIRAGNCVLSFSLPVVRDAVRTAERIIKEGKDGR